MKTNRHLIIDSLAEVAARRSAYPGRHATRREKKHQMLLAFMAQAQRTKPVPKKPSLIKSLLSVFL